MSVIAALMHRNAYGFEDAFGAKDCTSWEMRSAIKEWFELYFAKEATEEEDPCQQIPYVIVNTLKKTVFAEYSATCQNKFAQRVIDTLNEQKGKAMQLALIGGECLLKPIPMNDSWRWTVVNRSNTLVFGRDADGVPTDIGTIERTSRGATYYTLLERRTVEGGYLTIRNKLFKSPDTNTLGSPCSLLEIDRYADFPEEYTFPLQIGSVGMVHMKTPMENCVDGSDDGVSVYAAAVGLIHNINRNEAQLNGEFMRGESRIITSADLLKKDKNGRRSFSDHLFVGLDEEVENVGVTIFSPALREQSFLSRKTEYLRNAESVIGIKRGLLGEVEAAERTATEITSSEGNYNLSIIDLQAMWEKALRDAVQICSVIGRMYKVPGAVDVDPDGVVVDWGNGILYDEDKTWADYMSMVSAKLLKPEIAVGWRFGMPTETEEDLAKVREKYMPVIEGMIEDADE